uniref:C2 domain-containing protein n=1 Tax=Auxenochlorella protothecoides TaxID=3075 RepID=A0A1D2A348_AUXPR
MVSLGYHAKFGARHVLHSQPPARSVPRVPGSCRAGLASGAPQVSSVIARQPLRQHQWAGAQLPGGQRRRRHTSPPRTRVLCALGLRSLRAPPALLSRDARLVLLGGLAATLVWFALSFLGTLPSVRAALRRFVWWRGAARAAPRLAPEARAALEREALRSTDSDEVPAAGAAPLPDGEDVEWFNMCWRKVWRVYQRGIESWLAEMLQPVLDGVVTDSPVPAMLKRIRIMEVNLDHEAPYFSNMRRRSSRKDSDLSGVVDLRYTGGAQVVLALEVGQGRWKAKIPVLVSDLDVEATVWLKLRLAPMAPYIGAVSFAFVGPPAIKIQLAPYGRVRLMNIPVLQPILSRLLTVALPGLMTLPQRLDIDVPPAVTAIAEAAVGRDAIMRAVASAVLQADALEHALLAALPLGPQGDAGGVSLPDFFTGELQVTLVEARALPVWGFPWQSNPYCRLTLGGQAVQSRRDSETSHASRHRAPAWNQEFTFLVEDPRVQVLEIVVRDSPITGRTEVGRVVFPLARLPSEGVLKAWLPVVTDATGQPCGGAVLLEMEYTPFHDESEAADGADPGSDRAGARSGGGRPGSPALPPGPSAQDIVDVKTAASASSRAHVAASAAMTAVAVTKAAAARAAARLAQGGASVLGRAGGGSGDEEVEAVAGSKETKTRSTPAVPRADVGPGAGGKSSDGSADEDGALPDKERPAAPGPGPDPRGVPSLPAYAGPADDLLPSSMQNGSVSAPDSAPSPRGLRQLADAASSVEDLVQLRGALRLLTQEIDELGGSGTAGSTGAAAELVASAEREATQAVLAGDVAGAVQALRFAARAVETTLAQAGARGMQAGGEGGDGRCVETEGSDAGRRGVDEEANSSGREPEFEALHSSQAGLTQSGGAALPARLEPSASDLDRRLARLARRRLPWWRRWLSSDAPAAGGKGGVPQGTRRRGAGSEPPSSGMPVEAAAAEAAAGLDGAAPSLAGRPAADADGGAPPPMPLMAGPHQECEGTKEEGAAAAQASLGPQGGDTEPRLPKTTESDQPVPAWVVFWALSASVTAIYLALLLQNAHHLK